MGLKPFGRLVVLTFSKWELMVIRRFLRDLEEPSEASRSAFIGLESGRLAELYPVMRTSEDYVLYRTRKPIEPSSSEVERNRRSKVALLHVFEKRPRKCSVLHQLPSSYPVEGVEPQGPVQTATLNGS